MRRMIAITTVCFLAGCVSDAQFDQLLGVASDAFQSANPSTPGSSPTSISDQFQYLSSPPTATTPVERPDSEIDVVVDSSSSWQDTGVFVSSGDRIAITASGLVSSGGTSSIPPTGISRWANGSAATADASCVAPSEPMMSLVGRIGNGVPFKVGSSLQLTAATSGNLFLCANDNNFTDNRGSWSVSIAASSNQPQASITPPNSTAAAVPSQATVEVSGAKRWVDSGVDVTAGQFVAISASGLVTSGGTSSISPAGITRWDDGSTATADETCVVPNAPMLSLVGRIGEGMPFAIGASTQLTAWSTGHLYLSANDNYFTDNHGAWIAEIEVR